VTFTPLETTAVLLIALNVWLAIRENIWTWPTGIAGVILYTIINYETKLYANAVLQIFYLLLSIHGWYEWLHGGVNKTELHVRRTTPRQWIGCTIASVVLTVIIVAILRWTHDEQPLLDGSTTAISFVGQWMLNEKLLENWWLWLLVDIAYVPMYLTVHKLLTALLYAGFCVMCIVGLLQWKKSLVSHASV